jgi:hypothetical protein
MLTDAGGERAPVLNRFDEPRKGRSTASDPGKCHNSTGFRLRRVSPNG